MLALSSLFSGVLGKALPWLLGGVALVGAYLWVSHQASVISTLRAANAQAQAVNQADTASLASMKAQQARTDAALAQLSHAQRATQATAGTIQRGIASATAHGDAPDAPVLGQALDALGKARGA